MKIKTKHILLNFLHLMKAYKFCKDCEIPASAQTFPALVLHRSCDKNGLLTCVKLRKRLTVAHYQEGNKYQVNRCLRYQVKSSLCKMETFALKGQQLIADCQHPLSDMGKKILTSFYSTSVLVVVPVFSINISISQRKYKSQISRLVSWYCSSILQRSRKWEISSQGIRLRGNFGIPWSFL